MADDVVVTEHQREAARMGLMNQLRLHGLMEQYETDERLRAFVENQVEVKAADMAWDCLYNKALMNSLERENGLSC